MILQFYLTECLWIINLILQFSFFKFYMKMARGLKRATIVFKIKEHFQNSLVIARNEAIRVDSKIYNF